MKRGKPKHGNSFADEQSAETDRLRIEGECQNGGAVEVTKATIVPAKAIRAVRLETISAPQAPNHGSRPRFGNNGPRYD